MPRLDLLCYNSPRSKAFQDPFGTPDVHGTHDARAECLMLKRSGDLASHGNNKRIEPASVIHRSLHSSRNFTTSTNRPAGQVGSKRSLSRPVRTWWCASIALSKLKEGPYS